MVVKRDDKLKQVVLSPRIPEILQDLSNSLGPQASDKAIDQNCPQALAQITRWRAAHARFALRCEPPHMHKFSIHQLTTLLPDCLRARRRLLQSKLRKDEMLLTISQFPLLGSHLYIDGQDKVNGPLLRSRLLSENCLNPSLPFPLEIGGILDRRGRVPYTAVPVFKDEKTEWPFVDKDLKAVEMTGDQRDSACVLEDTNKPVVSSLKGTSFVADPQTPPKEDSIPSTENSLLLDSPLFGIGSGGVLRVTLCAATLEEARVLYDQLAPISAIMTALTAATPIVKGHLVDRDSYWDVQCSTVDDRSAQERGIVPLTTAKGILQKSRFGSIDAYLGPGSSGNDVTFRNEFNDLQFTHDSDSYYHLRENGVDNRLSQHVSRLFIRDLHYASSEMLEKDRGGQEHFKRFLGCNRQNVCLYPPNHRANGGWEVEFMSMEVQLTDEENAALITFMVLLSRAILSFRLNFYLPISLMNQNISRSQEVDALNKQLFFFRRDPFKGRDAKSSSSGRLSRRGGGGGNAPTTNNTRWYTSQKTTGNVQRRHLGSASVESAEYVELSVDEIINGCPELKVNGILNIIMAYLPGMGLDYRTEQRVRHQLRLIEMRASGQLCTLATWMRTFVREHPEYQQDSRVSSGINYDMLCAMNDIAEGRRSAPEFL